MDEREIDERQARIRSLALEVGIELPTTVWGAVEPIGVECPRCGFDSLVMSRATEIWGSGVAPAGGLVWCGRDVCPSNQHEREQCEWWCECGLAFSTSRALSEHRAREEYLALHQDDPAPTERVDEAMVPDQHEQEQR